MKPIKTILCPVDFSAGSRSTLSYAVDLSNALGARVHLLHVHPIATFVGPDGGMLLSPTALEELTAKSNAALRELAAPLLAAGHTVDVQVRDGAPAEEITRFAETVGADLIVMGTHGRSGVARMFLGSVTERVVRTSLIPVLTLRLPDR